jgi:hypothetical protein
MVLDIMRIVTRLEMEIGVTLNNLNINLDLKMESILEKTLIQKKKICFNKIFREFSKK